MNPAAEIMFDRPLAVVKQQAFSELFQVLDDTSFELIGIEKLTTANKNTEVQAIRNLQGKEIAVHITSSMMHDEKKRSIGVVYAFNDLSEIIRVHQKIAFVATMILISTIIIGILVFYNLPPNVDYFLEWNYFLVLLFFYLLSSIMWKKLPGTHQ